VYYCYFDTLELLQTVISLAMQCYQQKLHPVLVTATTNSTNGSGGSNSSSSSNTSSITASMLQQQQSHLPLFRAETVSSNGVFSNADFEGLSLPDLSKGFSLHPMGNVDLSGLFRFIHMYS
jgi:hypothetical protein